MTNAIKISDLLETEVYPVLGIERIYKGCTFQSRDDERWRGSGPLRESKSGTSFVVSPRSFSWWDAGLQDGGGPLQFRYRLRGGNGKLRGHDYITVARELFTEAGVPFPEEGLSPADAERIREREQRTFIVEKVEKICATMLWTAEGEVAREYLNDRGLSDSSIKALGLGFYAGRAEVRSSLEADGVRLPDYRGQGEQRHDLAWRSLQQLEGYIIFPWRDAQGRGLTLYGRWPGDPPKGKPKTWALGGTGSKRAPLFLDRAIAAGTKHIRLVEGVLDASVAQALGDTSVVACVGASLSKEQAVALSRSGIEGLTIALDPDSAGENGAQSCIRTLASSRIDVYIAPKLPDGLDPDEYILKSGIEAWHQHCSQADHSYRWVAKRILTLQAEETWTDRRVQRAWNEAEAFARSVTFEHRKLDLERFFWPTIHKQLGAAPRNGPTLINTSNSAAHGEPISLLSMPLTDSGNAERILALYGSDIRYCHEMKKFLFYDGRVWTIDNSRKVNHLAKKTARLLFAQAADLPVETPDQREYKQAVERFARKSESAKGRKDALECLAAEQDGVPISEVELDPDPWLLNTNTGTIDFRAGGLRPHQRTDLISKIIRIDYDARAACTGFIRALEEIMGISPESGPEERKRIQEVIAYLQKLLGCGATGKAEKVIIVFYGSGNNGKTTLLEIVRAALGDKEYAGEINIESLMAKPKEAFSNNAINSDLADLRGCRFVSSSEVEQGQRLSLSRVKYLTGMGQIKARRLGQDWISFKPSHTLFLDCNHRPVITDPNDAIWNRVMCIPFTVTIKKIDPAFPEKLRAELPGILAWIVEGAIRYHREGLGDPPPEVQAATESYRQESDRLKDFFEDQCVLTKEGGPEAWKNNKQWVPVGELYPYYAEWAVRAGEKHPLSKTVFDERLRSIGRKEDRVRPDGGRGSKQVRVWLGIRFRTPQDDEPIGPCDNDKACDSV